MVNNLLEVRFNHVMMHEHFIQGLYLEGIATVLKCSNDVQFDPIKSRWCVSLDPNDI